MVQLENDAALETARREASTARFTSTEGNLPRPFRAEAQLDGGIVPDEVH